MDKLFLNNPKWITTARQILIFAGAAYFALSGKEVVDVGGIFDEAVNIGIAVTMLWASIKEVFSASRRVSVEEYKHVERSLKSFRKKGSPGAYKV
jgi:hypothetical protein